jgi:superfamily II DNA or RNA helicase
LAHKIQTFLSKWLPNIGLVGDGSRNFGRITVYTLASLHHCPFDADFMLVDEAHEVLSDKYSKYLVSSLYTRNFAFTASPTGRSDGSDIRMESVFGPKIFHITYDEAVKLGLVVPIRVEWSDVRLMTNPCKNMEGARKKRYGLWQNDERNKIIAQKARTFGPDEQVQILVETIEHAVFLRQHLPEYTLIYANMKPEDRIAYIKHGLLPAGEPLMTSERMEENRKAFEAGELKKVITTNVWAVGIDPTQLTALIRADAGASEIMDVQAPGRVSRTHSSGGKNVGIVCDFFDQFDHATSQRAKKRVKHYRDMGWSQYAGPAGEVFTPESKLFRKV